MTFSERVYALNGCHTRFFVHCQRSCERLNIRKGRFVAYPCCYEEAAILSCGLR